VRAAREALHDLTERVRRNDQPTQLCDSSSRSGARASACARSARRRRIARQTRRACAFIR
jgi:hypothetical protein